MSFCYSLISRGNIPLCQHCTSAGNFDLYYQKFLADQDTELGKVTIIKHESLIWGILREEGNLTFLCVVKIDCDENTVHRMLEEMKSKFLRYHGTDWENARTFAFQSDFQPKLQDLSLQLQRFSSIQLSSPSDVTSLPSLIPAKEFMNLPLATSPSFDKKKSCRSKGWWIVIVFLITIIVAYIAMIYSCHGLTMYSCF